MYQAPKGVTALTIGIVLLGLAFLANVAMLTLQGRAFSE